MGQSLRTASRTQWSSGTDAPTLEELQLGSLLRIADASEKMAARYDELLRDRDYYKNRTSDLERELRHRTYQVRSLRGAITRLEKVR